MVLVVGMKKLLLGLIPVALTGVIGDGYANEATDRLEWEGRDVVLLEQNGQCWIQDSEAEVKLNTKLPAPCRFLRRDGNAIQHETYEDVGTVFIFVGKPATDVDYSDYSGIEPEAKCSRYSRGLIVLPEGELSLSKECFRGQGLHCPNIGLDEKVFYSFAHHEEPEFLCD